MKLSTLAQLINRTIELTGDTDLNAIVLHPTKDHKDNIRMATLKIHRAELTLMIDPQWDSQKGLTLHLSDHFVEHGFITESVYSRWDIDGQWQTMSRATVPAPLLLSFAKVGDRVSLVDEDENLYSDAISIIDEDGVITLNNEYFGTFWKNGEGVNGSPFKIIELVTVPTA